MSPKLVPVPTFVRCTATNGSGAYADVRCSYPLGHDRIEIPAVGDADHGNADQAIWWDSEEPNAVCDHSAGFTSVNGPLVCSTCGVLWSKIRPTWTGGSHLLGEDGSAVLGLDDDEPQSSYADADTPPLFFPYNPVQLAEPVNGMPTIPTDLNGYLVIHAGDIKAGDLVTVIQVEGGALRLTPVQEPGTRSPLLQRIYDAIDKGWEDHEFDTDCATDAVQDLLVELLRELDDYYYGTLSVPVAELASMVKEGRWIK